jgi:hypothetical protein
MAKELLNIANVIYFSRFRVVWRPGSVTNTFARFFARFARTLPTPTASLFLWTLILSSSVVVLASRLISLVARSLGLGGAFPVWFPEAVCFALILCKQRSVRASLSYETSAKCPLRFIETKV